jgi:predicted metal-dependent phosphoesterase TrpH
MTPRIDLHLHTNCSDGLTPPPELLRLVRGCSLHAFSITDHDTLEGFRLVAELMSDLDPELVPGLELSCETNGKDLHLLAYCFSPDNRALNDWLTHFQNQRNQRGREMVKKLNELGVRLTFDDVRACAWGKAVGRPHVAEALYRKRLTSAYEEAFRLYIGETCPAYVPKEHLAPAEAIDLVHRACGLAVLAHPVVTGVVDQIECLAAVGLDGVEVHHPDHKLSETDQLKEIALKNNLLCTGGSDFHGRPGRCGSVGSEPVPVEYLENLKAAAQRRRSLC